MDFDWDAANLEHIARHKVEADEVEEMVGDPAALVRTAHRGPRNQKRYAFVGATEAERVLAVILEERGERSRTVTARPASIEERRAYAAQEENND
ncbi:BrnT family toxin [Deinococcus marmoris]|uniref:BrnT family toxin n=1 Tax=Deinococcus marmoris TaxID=249408 RepID=A0A1U7NVA0_9DEIO|nr:BrnT family toxin [Deinococcus marmoris]OLV16844.1 hypothetical protein BOO71_0010741 [Deinococcus marmoris]